jgi:hypothetical protein
VVETAACNQAFHEEALAEIIAIDAVDLDGQACAVTSHQDTLRALRRDSEKSSARRFFSRNVEC